MARHTALRFVLAFAVLLGALAYGLAERAAPEGHPAPAAPTATADTANTATTTARTKRGAVALVGDSLSAQAVTQEVAELKAAGWGPVVVNALPGRRVPDDSDVPPSSGLSAVDQVRSVAPDPHSWIVELGTNDTTRVGADAAALRGLVESMLAKIGPGHRVIWVNVHNRLVMEASAVFNLVLAQVAKERPDFFVVDWMADAEHGGYLISDGIHLTPAGTQAFGALIAERTTEAATTGR